VSKAHINSSKQSKLELLLVACGIILGFIAIFLLLNNNQKMPKAPSGTLTATTAPSALKPNAQVIAKYAVPPTYPKYITIPTIGVSETRIIRLGLISDGSIAVPNNIYDTGWYDGSARPGQRGAMFIYGHVSSWTANGVFFTLKKLQPGASVKITRGDNKTYTYHVVSTKIYPYNHVDMSQVLAPVNPDKPGLNLMTCTGQIIKGTSEFNERLVVFTSLVSD
jgi:sortase (surface protein transpeptidase)